MSVKLLVTLLSVLMLASLFGGLHVLFRDNGSPQKKTTFYLLVARVSIAIALFSTIAYGVYTGEIKSKAPWDNRFHGTPEGYSNHDAK